MVRPERVFRRRRRVALGVVVVVVGMAVVLATGLLQPAAAKRRPRRVDGPRAAAARATSVGVATCTFVERTPTPTYDDLTRSESPTRTIVTEIRYPTLHGRRGAAERGAAPDVAGGPWPTVLFASGYRLDPRAYAPLLDAWVRSGLVVVSPLFPYTNPDAYDRAVELVPGADPEDDLPNEPADLAFVARTAIAASIGRDAACPVLRGLVDPHELGLAGQSDGGQVAGMLGYDSRYRVASPKFLADAVLSGMANGDDPYGGGTGYPALLVVESSQDTCNTPQEAAGLYGEIVQPDRWFLEDHSATHLGPYTSAASATFPVVAAVTARFFGLVLHGERPGPAFVALGNRWPRLAALTTGPAPTMAPRGDGGVGCYAR